MSRPSQASRLSTSRRSSTPGNKQPSTSKTNTADKTLTGSKKTQKSEKKTLEFQLPPLSVVGKKREINFEEIRRKIVRRNQPEGEDKKQLASILKHIKDSKVKIKVHEFVSLVARYTTDNGETLQKVMQDDLAAFRKTVTKVYENMTQDVSDVLVNEQIQTSNYYQERYDMFNEKMLWMITEIFQMIPEFDFEKYAQNTEGYLDIVAPLPTKTTRNPLEVENQRRQEAFHRLQWLKIEGGRLAEENKRLEKKLNSVMTEHEKTQTIASMKSKIMNERKLDLEEREHEQQEHLRELEDVLAKSAIRAEAYIRLEEDEESRLDNPKRAKQVIKKTTKVKPKKRPEWSSVTAADIEAAAARSTIDAESAALDERKRLRRKDKSPFRANKSGCRQGTEAYPGLPSAVKFDERNVQHTTTTVHERRREKQDKKTCGSETNQCC